VLAESTGQGSSFEREKKKESEELRVVMSWIFVGVV
jgi:hypothetical protein